ncbi:MAG: PEP-CTERM sorting domain-containing protein [Candidatus Krumholzibacteria bacterium]|nr:PEP-CTERM sorting domain-containing protein [Candidatus Krumholzibacteria bacterium]MDH4337943.1 PEP-CTERM sorting domain-containing protein [Candidatus Krumholzibacteria bacterium]MDH5270311.1 PEP-CTERM sorting domain-containing protein [Candidatus Krumholzibacteria bacterium]MDH5628461.1 PEP-CTERM sorting domain-containing protein [Candidatus Krumholzibacteria bacterium]
MKARICFAAVAIVLIAGTQSSASVISASSQTAGSRSAERVDYLSVTSIQTDLNASMREAADASAPTALRATSAPSTASGGFLLTAGQGSGYNGVSGNAMESLFKPDHDKTSSAMKRDVAGPGTVIANGGSHGGRWGGNHGSGGRWGNNGGGKKGGKTGGDKKDGGWENHRRRGGGGGGIQAAPEPSTWLLLGAGLTMVGIYEVIRRRS